MSRLNGWEIYLRIKDIRDQQNLEVLNVDHVTDALGIGQEEAKENLVALSVLKFIKFTDSSRTQFTIIDLDNIV